jgi:hypothetical protein
MKRTTLNAIIDTITFFPLFFTAITGIIIWLYLPRGLAIGALGTIASHQTFLGIQQQVWLDTHMYVGLVFTALVAIHLILHWGYIKSLPRRFAKKVTKPITAMRRLHMRTPTLNAIIDTISFFPLLVSAVTGIIIWLYLPRGQAQAALGTAGSHQTFLGIQRIIWLDVHTYLGLLFTALVVTHLILHWHYIKHFPQRFAEKKTKKDHSARRFLALLLIGVLIVAAVIAAVYALNPSPSSTNLQQNVSATASSSTTKTMTTTMTAKATGSVTPTASSTSRVTSTPTPNPTPTSINGIPTSVNGFDYIYYHNLNDRSTCVLCHTNM